MATPAFPEYLTIGAVIIGTEACWCENLRILHSVEFRGEDRIVPGQAGTTAYARVRDSIFHDLELRIFGDVDSDGLAHASVDAGLTANIAELRTVVDGTVRTVVWNLGDGTTRSADCQLGPLVLGERAGIFQYAVLGLNVPAGQFV